MSHLSPSSNLNQLRVASPALSNRSSGTGEEDLGSPSSSTNGTIGKTEREKALTPTANSSQPYKCPLCPDTLTSQKEFTAHIRGHNEVKPHTDPNDPTGQAKVYYCCLCGKMLSSFSSLDRHMLVHSGERPFSCELCGQTFTTNGNMHRHKRTHGARDSHESDVSSGGSSGGSKRGGRKRKGSMEPANISSEPSAAPSKRMLDSKVDMYSDVKVGSKCPHCSATFFSDASLEAHLKTQHEDKDILCNECDSKFDNFSLLKVHKNMFHHKNPLDLALFNFPSMAALHTMSAMANINNLQKAETKEEPFLDLSPEKSIFSAKKNEVSMASPISQNQDQVSVTDSVEQHDENEGLLREMKLKGEFPCRLCPIVYPNLRALKGHNKEHLNKAPYACNVAQCTYSSCDKSTLARHMRTHTGEKPFECKECNFGFTTKANCERHVKNKHGKNSRNEIRQAIAIHDMDENNSKDVSDESIASSPTKCLKKDPEAKKGPKTSPSLFAPYHSNLFRSMTNTIQPETPLKDDKEIADAPLDLSRQSHLEIDPKVNNGPSSDFPSDFTFPQLPSKMQEMKYPLFPSLAGMPFSPQNPFSLVLHRLMSKGIDYPNYFLALQQQEVIRRQTEALMAQQAHDKSNLLAHLSSMQSNLAPNPCTLKSQQQKHPISSVVNSPKRPLGEIVPPSVKDLSAHVEKKSNPLLQPEFQAKEEIMKKYEVLMKKQKQRRYRTERPYTCNLCNGKFTLRSNMERHVKQQHPEYAEKLKQLYPNEDDEWNGDDEMLEESGEKDSDDLIDVEAVGKDAPAEEETNKQAGMETNLEHESEEEDGYLDNEDEVFTDSNSGSDNEEKKSAYASAPNRIPCPHCGRKFPWTSSLNRHLLTHTGDKPYKCPECMVWFTTKSNCDRHLLRKHTTNNNNNDNEVKNSPERPFKCQLCPSSTFSSEQKLKCHQEKKHFSILEDANPLAEHEKHAGEDQSKSSKESITSECPFRCHLCDADGFADRSEAIQHLKASHPKEYENLVERGAFDAALSNPDLDLYVPQNEETFDHIRGKFPDYINRKISCICCMRKFWSAEDLRRHVRTHTGERPYSCDICHRKFTLKHSMLRHRKKHDSGVSSGGEASESESEVGSSKSNYTSSIGRSSSPEEECMEKNGNVKQKKRANLMEKIEKLSQSRGKHEGDPEIQEQGMILEHNKAVNVSTKE